MRLQAIIKRIILPIIAAAMSASALFGGNTASEMPFADGRELPLPTIPQTLRTPRERAEYLLMHFWDALDFADVSASRDRKFMEQNFANFASVFPHADTTAVAKATGVLLRRAEVDKQAYTMLTEIAEKYLYEPDSPLCNDNFYMLFLEEMLRSPILDEYEKIRPAYQLKNAQKNRTGSMAADFGYIGRDSIERTLHGTNAETVLLVFYDPECEHCMEIMVLLRDDAAIRSAVNEGRLSVIAVFADGDRESWKPAPDIVPDGWTEALDATGVQERELYSFKQLPALYLLDADKRVLLKECSPDKLSQELTERFQNTKR